MADTVDLLAEQLRYYRARAAEYDVTSFGVRTGERAAVPRVVDRLTPTGDVLELACGTGVWTAELARWATTVTAVDAAAEMLQLAARRTAGLDVQLLHADMFEWTPPRTYDVVFFGFWLSHVPSRRFHDFWDKVGSALRPGGRVLFVDELPVRAVHEEQLTGEVATRTLGDHSTYRVVKRFYQPQRLVELLSPLGWQADVTPVEHGWYVGEARRTGSRGQC